MRRQTALTPEELTRLLEVAKQDSTRSHLIVLLGFRHGLRASEIAGLTLQDIDGQHIVIRRKKGSLKTIQAIDHHPGQPLLDEAKVLRKWLKERRDDGSDALITSREGGHLDRTMIFKLFKRLAQTADLAPEKCHPHVLKHSLACQMISKNVPLSDVQQRLGHASMASTLRYIHSTDAQADAASRKALMAIF